MSEHYETKNVAVDVLIPYAMNSRQHDETQVAQLAASIREFGFTAPILVDDKNNVIAGHGRLLAARKLNMKNIPAVVVTGLDDRKRRALVIADNKIALNSTWDADSLLLELQDLGDDFGALMGFSEKELLDLFKVEDFNIPEEKDLVATYEVAVECSNETEQETVYNLLNKEGYKCRILTM